MTASSSSDIFEEDKMPAINPYFEPKVTNGYTLRSSQELSFNIEVLKAYYSNLVAVPSFADIVRTLVNERVEELEKTGELDRLEEARALVNSSLK